MANELNIYYGSLADQKFDFYPAGAAGNPKRAVVMIHGGGWTAEGSGNKNEFTKSAIYLQGEGYSVANMNYRKVVPGLIPQIQDVFSVMGWLQANKGTSEIVLYGHSAGATLALLVTCCQNTPPDLFGEPYPVGCKIIAGIGSSGTYDHLLLNSRPRGMWEAWAAGHADDADVIKHADAGDVPLLLMAGSADHLSPWESSQQLHDKIPTVAEYHLQNGGTHNGMKLWTKTLNTAVAGWVTKFLDRV